MLPAPRVAWPEINGKLQMTEMIEMRNKRNELLQDSRIIGLQVKTSYPYWLNLPGSF